jgi:hypothetical protein
LKKVQEEEKPTLQFEKEATFLFEKKAIEDHKHRLEEDVQVQSREVKRSKQVGFSLKRLEHSKFLFCILLDLLNFWYQLILVFISIHLTKFSVYRRATSLRSASWACSIPSTREALNSGTA